ncbi:SH3 domain-containing protein [Streptomyces sp. NPDC056672]|uniref:SH3 domain-containing protein n=1 Tax=Streptomyces sp. NPDC056672 TaxID=3345906 RepID=UPI0036B8CCBE
MPLPYRRGLAATMVTAAAVLAVNAMPTAYAWSWPSACDYAYNYLPVESPTTSGLNFRRGPGTGHSSIGHLNKGDRMVAYCFADVSGPDDWDYVRIDKTTKSGIRAGTWGWVSERYLKVVGHRG